ncbi:MAG: adenylyl-sulfate kinase [Rhodospirillaceae bacterium]|nr:adenylyl-sulfate kinase [Rhodospirillaceae bacterium]|tara:strand:+ start:32269 stop:34167 length:1899 start_codon:yes stop_codon:yes gene_type:complete
MAHQSDLIAEDIHAYLKSQEEKSLLRFITCGSVDDGKSTLIGRLLYDSKLIFEDQLAAIEADSKKVGSQGGEIDLALLVDGLQAEREQGITIDVAYRFFSTDKRKFIVADTPGHDQYTRNMATGASTAELAIILVDACKGILTQTRRHSFIVSLLGIRHVILAVNKMDLVDWDADTFETIAGAYRGFAHDLGIDDITCIPVSALTGANVFGHSPDTPWYSGPTLLDVLETVDVSTDIAQRPLRMPVQWVNRPNLDFRGFSGTIASGTVRPGDRIKICPSERESTVTRIVTYDGDLESAFAGQSVTLVLADEVDVSRGDILAEAENAPDSTDQFAAHLLWMHDDALLPERQYLMKIGTKITTAQVTDLRYKIDVNTMEQVAGKTLELNEVAYCNFALDQPIAFDPYKDARETGGFVMIDRFTNGTVGAGMIDFGLRRATNLTWHDMEIGKELRAQQKGQKPCILWFTGLSGSGKSTTANQIEKKLASLGRHSYLLDGDNVRHGLNKDLGFTDADRVENIRRVAEVSRLFVDSGLIVLVSFISPFRDERRMARELMGEGEFIEVFVDTPLELCEQRDPKGLYKKARAGEIKNFTGIDSDYEPPENAEVVLKTADHSVNDLADQVVAYLRDGGYL